MRVATLALAVVVLAACDPAKDSATIEQGELAQLVLQSDDVPRVFVRFDQGPQLRADSPGGRRADPARFGRTAGWKARYRRSGSTRTAGPLVIDSRVDAFDSASGAEDELEAARDDLDQSELGWKPIDEPGLGDESFAATLVQSGLSEVRYYQVVWREDNATASLNVNGFEGRLPFADVLELARKQEQRIARAAS
ncbi:MAG TPA: hypothetical protein VGU26_01625 [Gaiellaceae bacterium]|nr:hypothetical protein [Gaiellaceae bacterium]